MAFHKDFPDDPHATLDPAIRWFPADGSLRETAMHELMPTLAAALRRQVVVYQAFTKQQREIAFKAVVDGEVTHTTVLDPAFVVEPLSGGW